MGNDNDNGTVDATTAAGQGAQRFYQLPAARRMEVSVAKAQKNAAFVESATSSWEEYGAVRTACVVLMEAFDALVFELAAGPSEYAPAKSGARAGALTAGCAAWVRPKYADRFSAFGVGLGVELTVKAVSGTSVMCSSPDGTSMVISRTHLQREAPAAGEQA